MSNELTEPRLIPLNGRKCECRLCEEGRFIQRLCTLLPEAEANELHDWYCAMLDCRENDGMEFYWIEQRAKELIGMVSDFSKRRELKERQ